MMRQYQWMERRDLTLCGVEDGHHMTLERAEELRAQGAYLELDGKGWVWIYRGRPRQALQREILA